MTVVVYVFEVEGVDVAGEIAAANIISELSCCGDVVGGCWVLESK